MKVSGFDHLVLTVADIKRGVEFYVGVMGMRKVIFGEQKINLHRSGSEFEPKAARVQPGSADLCFIVDLAPDELVEHLTRLGVDIIDGPVARSGAPGPVTPVYLRDPDGNLIELSSYDGERNPW